MKKKRRTVKVVMYFQIPDEDQVTETYYRNLAYWGNECGMTVYDLDGEKIFSGRTILDDISGIIRKCLRPVVKSVLKGRFLLPKGHPKRGKKSYERK